MISVPSLSELAKLGFSELSRSKTELEKLNSYQLQTLKLDYFYALANPDQALHQLVDLVQRHFELIKTNFDTETFFKQFLLLSGASTGFQSFFLRHPEELETVAKFESGSESPPGKEEFYRELESYLTRFKSIDENQAVAGLRIGYRSALLKIVLWDLTVQDPIKAFPLVADSLSALAEATLQHSFELAVLQSGFSQAELPKFTIIGMGKTGAEELNYLSDVDVIFVVEDVDQNAGFSTEQAIDRASNLAKLTIKNISDFGAEPALWEVDPNLRPEGKSGPLVRTLSSHMNYYDRWAEDWEFQALLKARVVAGDNELGEQYLKEISERVWKAASKPGFVESVQRMRKRVLENIPKEQFEHQLKLGPGGLRDIEFTVQLLQLVHGTVDPSLRLRSTLQALAQLSENGYIGRSVSAELDQDYRFLRLLEHRIQLSQLKRTHLMPSDPEQLRALARSTKLAQSAEELNQLWQETKQRVKSYHEQLFYRPLLSAVAGLSPEDYALTTDQAELRLAAIGYKAPQMALKHIEVMVSGVSRRATILRNLLPIILQWLAEGVNPDQGLLVFRRITEKLGNTHWYLGMLRDSSGAANRLCALISGSRFIAELLEQIPESVSWLQDDSELIPKNLVQLQAEAEAVISRGTEDFQETVSTLKSNRRREILRTSISWFLKKISVTELAESISQITEVLVSAFAKILEEKHQVDFELAIFAMGRFGGLEQSLSSDVDLILVYRAPESESETAQKIGEAFATELKLIAQDPKLALAIDYNLRPEGKQGRVIRSFQAYESYYERWLEIWEVQALLRGRGIYGSPELLHDFTKLINHYRYPAELTLEEQREIRRIKARVETERLPRGADPNRHLKLGRGSISDVEWLVQLYQLKYANRVPELQTSKTLDALKILAEQQIISHQQSEQLAEAWLLATEIRNAATLWYGKASDVLPQDWAELEGIARILGYPGYQSAQLNENYLAKTRRARKVFEDLFFDPLAN